MRFTKLFGEIVSFLTISTLCILPAAAAESDVCNAYQEPYFTYTELDSNLQTIAPSWNLYRVSNTPRGIMVRISAGEDSTVGLFNGSYGGAIDTASLQFCRQVIADPQVPYYTMTKARSYGNYGLLLHSKKGAGFLDVDCRNGKGYHYKAFFTRDDGSYAVSNEVTIYRLNQPRLTRTKTTKHTATVSWKANSKADGYQLQYARNRRFSSDKHTKKLSGSAATTQKLRKLKANKTYYIRVRSYKTVNGTTSVSVWSSCQAVKTAK